MSSNHPQAQRRTGGTGLGLFSLYKRVEALGGNCGVSSRTDKREGSLFWFTFPYRPDESAAIADVEDLAPTHHRSGSFFPSPKGVSQHASSRRMLHNSSSGKLPNRPLSSSSPFGSMGGLTPVFESENSLADKGGLLSPHCFESDTSLAERGPDVLTMDRSSEEVLPSGKGLTIGAGAKVGAKVGAKAGAKAGTSTISHAEAAAAAALAASSSDLESEAPDPPVRRMLLVDDTQSILKVAGRLLKMNGYTVDTAENGAQSLDKARAGYADGVYEFILSDLQVLGVRPSSCLSARFQSVIVCFACSCGR
jgi:hypothetical protein